MPQDVCRGSFHSEQSTAGHLHRGTTVLCPMPPPDAEKSRVLPLRRVSRQHAGTRRPQTLFVKPYCPSCRRQMCSSSTDGIKGFQCSGCLAGVRAYITSYGRLSVLPWCLYCRRRMQRYHGAREGFAASFMCPNCRMSTREYLVRYRPVPPQRPLRLMKIAESVLPSGLDPEVRQEARAALHTGRPGDELL
jgi:hypothetical protein